MVEGRRSKGSKAAQEFVGIGRIKERTGCMGSLFLLGEASVRRNVSQKVRPSQKISNFKIVPMSPPNLAVRRWVDGACEGVTSDRNFRSEFHFEFQISNGGLTVWRLESR